MATNKKNQNQKPAQPNKSRVTGTQVTPALALTSNTADKENAQPHRESQQGRSSASRDEPQTMAAVLKRLEDMEERFAKERNAKEALEAVIEALHEEGKENTEANPSTKDTVLRPRGTCSQDWSLQIEMGLAGSANKDAKYKALLRGVRDLVLNASINWEVGWKEISAAHKSKVFQVARKRYPILKLYVNDWATAEIIKQYIKNKRAHHYNNGWLEVPEKYSYLKENASKRNPTGSRVKRAKVETAAKKRAKHNENLATHSRKDAAGRAGGEMDEDEDVNEDEREGEGEDEE